MLLNSQSMTVYLRSEKYNYKDLMNEFSLLSIYTALARFNTREQYFHATELQSQFFFAVNTCDQDNNGNHYCD